MPPFTTILTHPGSAHKDEFLACCVLLASSPGPIVRREPSDADLADPAVAEDLLRAAPDPDADRDLLLEFDRFWRLPSHDGGETYVVERGEGPVILLSHGVTLSVDVTKIPQVRLGEKATVVPDGSSVPLAARMTAPSTCTGVGSANGAPEPG